MPMPIPRSVLWFTTFTSLIWCCGGLAAFPAHAATPAANETNISPGQVAVDERLGQVAALDVVLKDEAGQPVVLRELVDRPTILTLNYFRCAGICSPQLNGLAEAVNLTHAALGQGFRIITVSFDERDTPDIAQRKRLNYLQELKRPVTPHDWRFLLAMRGLPAGSLIQWASSIEESVMTSCTLGHLCF